MVRKTLDKKSTKQNLYIKNNNFKIKKKLIYVSFPMYHDNILF